MPRMVSKKEAAKVTGLSEWELGRGARAGDYPCIKIGEGRGKYLFDVDLLNEALTKRAMENMNRKEAPSNTVSSGIRKVV